MPGFFSPDGANAVVTRPEAQEPALPEGWCQDASAPGAGNGTVITASLLNQILANLRQIVSGLGGTTDGSDAMILNALLTALMPRATYDPEGVQADAFSMGSMAETEDAKILTTAERAKVALLTISEEANIDELQEAITTLLLFKGYFDDLAALEAEVPVGLPGEWAILSHAGDPASIALWDSTPGEWIDTGITSMGTDTDAFHKTVDGEIAALTEKGTPVGADHLLIEDSAASNAKKRATFTAVLAAFGLTSLAKLNVEDQALTGGVVVTSKSLGTISSDTVTPDPGDRPLQHYTNGGAHTLGVSSNAGSCIVDITNNASAGAITTSGFTKVTGSFTTTNGHKFRCTIVVGNAGSSLSILAMQ